MLRKKICTMLAAVMIATTVLGNNVQTVGATVVDAVSSSSIENPGSNSGNEGSTEEESETVWVNGTYEVENNAFKTGTTEGSSMNKFIERTSTIKVENDKVVVTFRFNEAGLGVVQEVHGATVNGREVEMITNEDKSISFIVPSVDSKININLTYAVGTWVHNTTFDLVNDISSIPTIDNSGSNDENQGTTLADGIYKLTNKTLKSGADTDSSIRKYIDENSIITVKDGKITVTMRYNEAGLETVKSTNSITINGENISFEKNEDGSISFDVESIDVLYTRAIVNLTYYHPALPEFIAPGGMHSVNIDLVHEGELTEYNGDNSSEDSGNDGETNKPGDENNGGNTGNEGSNNGGSNNGSSNNGGSNNGATEEQGAKVYTAKNEVTHTSTTGLSMARKALEEILKFEEVNGKKYVTLTFTPMGSTMMKDHVVYVNGNKVEATKSLNGEIVSLRFEVGSLEDSIRVSAYVTMMGSNVDFGVNILKDTLTLVTDGTTNNGGTTGGSTTNGSTTNGTSGNTTTTEETKVTKGKLYSIQNSVTHESETGRSMARKYLNATSKVEEIDGKYYVTLTFTGAEFMQSHEIYVNGKKVTATKSTSGDTTNVRFAVSSLSDTIKVKTYVVPMAREVEFGVTLLKDTLTFIKEYTVDTLPETGAPISSAAVAGLGMLLTSAGVVLAKKRK